ncbi:DUF6325 family protein [Demequina sp. B12]|uniref:DUF6325 family protein n=1 Tax=Demequina sp. B12 TaxID=2992757 RepID=UPI00237C2332|nr:DUF6325 family protein [Demequina sp. B12]MDE0573872.1 DUF6325 family protein [Demequina sp. B12]
MGPVEIAVIAFHGGEFKGDIVKELTALVESGTISIIDGVFVRRVGDDDLEYVELDQETDDAAITQLASLLDRVDGLVSEEDVEDLAADLPVGGAAAMLVFEHTWFKPLSAAVQEAGGELVDTIRVPGPVVEEVLAEIAALEGEGN